MYSVALRGKAKLHFNKRKSKSQHRLSPLQATISEKEDKLLSTLGITQPRKNEFKIGTNPATLKVQCPRETGN